VTVKSRAEAIWTGDLPRGKGVATLGTNALGELPVSWHSRTEAAGGQTSPEELISAAHAVCYCMALAYELSMAGQVPERLVTDAVCSFDQRQGNWRITTMELKTVGKVPGCDPALFEKLALAAKDGCPVSLALAGNVEISVSASLAD
jgi:osmotically inducible protein OsmC